MAARRKSSIMANRKLSQDFSRKLSAISSASDVSCISNRLGMDPGNLKSIVKDIMEMDKKEDWEVTKKITRIASLHLSYHCSTQNTEGYIYCDHCNCFDF